MRFDVGAHALAVQRELNVDGSSAHVYSSDSGSLRAAHSARYTRSGVSGSDFRRTPTASSMASAIADATPNVELSPTPFAPNGPLLCTESTVSRPMTGGISCMPGILYSANDALRSCPTSSNSMHSNSEMPSCMMAAPDICVSTTFGLIGVPQSTTCPKRNSLKWPVSVSTSTSTPQPPTIQFGVMFSDCPVSCSGDLYGGIKLPMPTMLPACMP